MRLHSSVSFLLSVALLGAIACNDDGVSEPGGTPAAWRVAVGHRDYTDFWGTSTPSFLLATDGGGGRVLRYVSGGWTTIQDGLGTVTGIDGLAVDDVYVCSEYDAYHFDGRAWRPLPGQLLQRLSSVYARGHDDVFFTGSSSLGGYIFHYDGVSIGEVAIPAVDGLFGMWGQGDDIVAVGENGSVLRYDGGAWGATIESVNHLFDVWGTRPDDLYAVGKAGTILHYDGTSWLPTGPGGAHDFLDVWGSSASDVYVVGASFVGEAEGIIYHFDGAGWSEVFRDGNDVRLSSVYGLPGTPVFAGGDGVLIESAGGGWKTLERSTNQPLQSVWSSSSNEVYAAGALSEVLHFDGDAWQRMQPGTRPDDLNCVRGGSAGAVFAAGDDGALARYDGAAWQPMAGPTTDSFTDVWEIAPDNVLVTGTGGLIARHDGTQWNIERQSAVGVTGETIRSLWVFAADDIYAVRNEFNASTIATNLVHYDGTGWSDVPFGVNLPAVDQLYGLWGSPTGDLFATSTRWVGRFDGTAWLEMDPGVTVDFTTVWGKSSSDVYVGGAFGIIQHCDGQQLTPMTSGVEDDILSIAGSAGGDVFAVTTAGTVLRFGH